MATYKKTNNTSAVYGESSAANLELQKKLNALGAGLKEDGMYGPLTQAANLKYANQLNATSVVPPPAPIVAPTLNYQLSPEEKALKDALSSSNDYYRSESRRDINENQIMADTLAQFQGEINATNAIFADKLARAKIEGAGRLGTSGAVNARRGLAGSSFGNAQTDNVVSGNQEIYNSIDNEKMLASSNLMGAARSAGLKAISEKRAAKEAGLSEYLKSLTGSVDSAKKRASDLAKNILASKFTYDQYTPSAIEEAAKSAGVTTNAIKSAYDELKKATDAETAKADLENRKSEADINKINAEIAKGKIIELGEGGMLYNTETGETFKNPKTFAPKDVEKNVVGPGAVLSDFPADIQAAAQSIFDGKSKLNEYPSAKRLQINRAFATLYSAEGGNELAQGAYSAITNLETHPGFKQAVGTNALFGFGKGISGTQSAGFLKQLDTLKANIKLVNIKYLKGTGALSDAEGKTLEDAGTSLDPRLPEADFKEELARVKAVLLKANNIATGSANNIIVAPDGSEIEIVD